MATFGSLTEIAEAITQKDITQQRIKEIEEKGEEVLESIPEDYTELSRKVAVCLYVDTDGYICLKEA